MRIYTWIVFGVVAFGAGTPACSSGSPTESEAPDDIIAVGITKDGQFTHEGDVLSVGELQERLGRYKKVRPEALIVIQNEEGGEAAKVVELMDLARQAGFRRITSSDPK
ncbi:MAG: biopolymer transporter ExbD [Myxococcota bacterium]